MKRVMIKVGAILVGVAILILGASKIEAQETGAEMLLGWRAHSYTPNSFLGKALPTVGTLITAGFDLVERGKILNLKDQLVYWYWNDNPVGGGKGVQNVSLRPTQEGLQVLTVKLPGFMGRSFTRNFEIPVVSPETIIEVAAKNGKFSSPNLRVYGQPYFFNASSFKNLVFLWEVNGQKPSKTEEVGFLDIKLDPGTPSGSQILIDLSIQNPKTFLEAASQKVSLIFSK